MSEQIKDGTGSGYLARVDSDQRLHTDSVIDTQEFAANKKGNAYNINTGVVNLTDANETSMIYFNNGEDEDFVIVAVVVGVWGSANGDGLDMIATFKRNPTTGDIITNTNDVAINSNRNYGSSNTLSSSLAYVGASGETATNGDSHILVRITEESRSFISINERLPKGTSFGVNITPPTGNDGMNCYVAIVGYLDA